MSRLLFLDDGDIAASHGLTRVIHPAAKHPGNPIIVPDRPWEENPFMGGTVRVEPGRGYRMWYQTYGRENSFLNLYAESDDGIDWQKPSLGLYEDRDGDRANNIFLSRLALRSDDTKPARTSQDHNLNVLYTPHLGSERTYTLISYDYAVSGYAPYDGYYLAFSPDGLHWTDGPQGPVIPGYADVGWFTYDEDDQRFRGIVKSYYNIRGYNRRSINATESLDGYNWTLPRPAIVPDAEDDAWAEGRPEQHTQFYGMPIVRYESLLLGFLQQFRVTAAGRNQDGYIDVQLTCSRDGQHWTRVGDRQPILALGPAGAWDSGMVFTGNSLVVDGDLVRIYYSGAAQTHETSGPTRLQLGLAVWPRDRLVGLRASAAGGEVQTTVHVAGSRLHVNADASSGELTTELVGEDGQVIAGCQASVCQVLRMDALDHVVHWQGSPTNIEGRSVSVRLHLHAAEVFSLWWD